MRRQIPVPSRTTKFLSRSDSLPRAFLCCLSTADPIWPNGTPLGPLCMGCSADSIQVDTAPGSRAGALIASLLSGRRGIVLIGIVRWRRGGAAVALLNS